MVFDHFRKSDDRVRHLAAQPVVRLGVLAADPGPGPGGGGAAAVAPRDPAARQGRDRPGDHLGDRTGGGLAATDRLLEARFLPLAQNILVGLSLGFAIRLVFVAIELAGQLIGLQIGLSFGAYFNPDSGESENAVSNSWRCWRC